MLVIPDIGERVVSAEAGSPLDDIVRRPHLDTTSAIWIIDDWGAVFPTTIPRPAPDLQQVMRRIRQWTGWSARHLGDVLGTSHTTVLAIEEGRRVTQGHSGDLKRRVNDAYDIIERVFLLAGHDPQVTARLLTTQPLGRRSAAEELRRGEPARAYLAAIDVLHPRPPGLLAADHPRQSGATAALHE